MISMVGEGPRADGWGELGDGGRFCAKLFNLREKGSLKLPHKDIHHMAATQYCRWFCFTVLGSA